MDFGNFHKFQSQTVLGEWVDVGGEVAGMGWLGWAGWPARAHGKLAGWLAEWLLNSQTPDPDHQRPNRCVRDGSDGIGVPLSWFDKFL